MGAEVTSAGTDNIEELKLLCAEAPVRGLLEAGASALARQQVDGGADLGAGEARAAAHLAATFEAVFLVAAADGELRKTEVDQLAALLVDLTGGAIGEPGIKAMIDRCADDLERDDYDERARQIALALDDPTGRRAAFLMAAGVAFVDGVVQAEEADVFALLASAFEIPVAESETLLARVRQRLGQLAQP